MSNNFKSVQNSYNDTFLNLHLDFYKVFPKKTWLKTANLVSVCYCKDHIIFKFNDNGKNRTLKHSLEECFNLNLLSKKSY